MSAECFARDLLERMRRAGSSAAARMSALLRAGELEAALEDMEHPTAALARQLSEDAAEAWLSHSAAPFARWLEHGLSALTLLAQLRLVRPEGYAYCALNPSVYEQALGARHDHRCGVAVVGVRSIGTSLSALVRSALLRRGVRSERITVRPQGHPWDRQLDLSGRFELFVRRWQAAHFLVVDEGPGLSGSTFLAVGEALERAGVLAEHIEFLTSHSPDPTRLVAPQAAHRWQRYLTTAVPSPETPDGALDLSAGAWRSSVYASESEWPACNPSLERHKYLESAGILVKFIGLPPYDEAPLARGQLLADAGFCPSIAGHIPGYCQQRWVDGSPLRSPVTGPKHLERLLDYLVFRSRECPADCASLEQLNQMLKVNVREAIGWEIPASLQLVLERPVYADGRLAFEEWIQARDGSLLKVDATDHGDGHLLPGPCDCAWDVAGAIIEWRLTPAQALELCEAYRRRTQDNVAARLDPYLLAYAALHFAQAQTATLSAAPAEARRLKNAGQHYLQALRHIANSKGHLDPACESWISC